MNFKFENFKFQMRLKADPCLQQAGLDCAPFVTQGKPGCTKGTNAAGSQAMMDCGVRYVGTGRIACATKAKCGRRNLKLKIENFK